MINKSDVLCKVDVTTNKECLDCKDKIVLNGSDGFVPVWCPPDCKLLLAAGFKPIVMPDLNEKKIKKENTLKVA